LSRERYLIAFGIVAAAILVVSGIRPYDRPTWWMEVAPILIVAPILVVSYRRFPLTSLLYGLIFVHAIILIVGGAYTYARVPLGFWIRDALSLGRNPYDKIGHFAQGLVPTLAAREILLRGKYLTNRRMTAFLSLCVAMTISAGYELIEWRAAVALGQGADAFLGTQGDPWDTQSDMFLALVGSGVGLLALARVQDRQMGRLQASAVRE
jgi:putative membrane protein